MKVVAIKQQPQQESTKVFVLIKHKKQYIYMSKVLQLNSICGAFDFLEELLVKIPTVGPQNLAKSDQISPGAPSFSTENE